MCLHLEPADGASAARVGARLTLFFRHRVSVVAAPLPAVLDLRELRPAQGSKPRVQLAARSESLSGCESCDLYYLQGE
jgi:hypothetical protein